MTLREIKESYKSCERVKRCLAEHPEDCVACLCPDDGTSKKCSFLPDYSKEPVPGRKVDFIKGSCPKEVKDYVLENE